MEFESIIRGRRSIRAYTTDPVAEATIREIIDEARWAPSTRNAQPWSVWVLTGAALARFKEAFTLASASEGPAESDFMMTADWPEACSLRIRTLMQSRAATLAAAGAATDPAAAMARMADLFGAPCLLVFGFDECLAEAYGGFDMGVFVDSVCLAAQDKGLGTCIVATLVRYPAVLREMLPGAEGQRFVVAMTLGHPNLTAPENTFERSRADVDELVTWVS